MAKQPTPAEQEIIELLDKIYHIQCTLAGLVSELIRMQTGERRYPPTEDDL